MVPHWTIPNAIALGNTFVLKPSELVPLSAGRIAELLREAGLPDGVFNVVHGGREAVEAICDHPGIEAVTLRRLDAGGEGGLPPRARAALKRVLALGGAKNHVIVMPDADPEMAAGGVLAAMSGCTGQRCMAASVMVAVSATDHIVERHGGAGARTMVVGRDVGPVITPAGQGADRARHHRGGAGRGEGAGRRTAARSCPGGRAASTSARRSSTR